jgi:hypothetical protein
MATTPATLSTRVENIIDKLTVYTAAISASYDNNFGTKKKESDAVEKQVSDYKNKSEMYDRLFQEAEYELQSSGGKTRQQTLQEYVILLFFSAYTVFFITVFIYSNMFYGLEKTIQIAVGLLILLVPIVILMIKYL